MNNTGPSCTTNDRRVMAGNDRSYGLHFCTAFVFCLVESARLGQGAFDSRHNSTHRS